MLKETFGINILGNGLLKEAFFAFDLSQVTSGKVRFI